MLLLHIHTNLYYTHFQKKVNKIVGKFFVILLSYRIISALSVTERPLPVDSGRPVAADSACTVHLSSLYHWVQLGVVNR